MVKLADTYGLEPYFVRSQGSNPCYPTRFRNEPIGFQSSSFDAGSCFIGMTRLNLLNFATFIVGANPTTSYYIVLLSLVQLCKVAAGTTPLVNGTKCISGRYYKSHTRTYHSS